MKHIKWLAAAALAVGLLAWPETALNAARTAMLTWVQSVAPALFPFMALMPLLTCPEAAQTYEKLLGWLMRPLFRLPGAAAPAVLIGMTAGSPAGAMAAARLSGRIGRRETERIAACACGLSPAFLIAGVGASMLGSAADGRLLYITQILTQLAMLALTRSLTGGEGIAHDTVQQDDAIRSAAVNLLSVCGYMMIFQVAAAVAAQLLGGKWAETALLCLLDLPSGARAVAALPLPREARMTLLAGMTGFGGLCIGAQNLAACRKPGLQLLFYEEMRLAAAALSAGVMRLLLRFNAGKAFVPAKIFPESTLIAVFFAIPVVISLATSFYLNKRKSDKNRPKNA